RKRGFAGGAGSPYATARHGHERRLGHGRTVLHASGGTRRRRSADRGRHSKPDPRRTYDRRESVLLARARRRPAPRGAFPRDGSRPAAPSTTVFRGRRRLSGPLKANHPKTRCDIRSKRTPPGTLLGSLLKRPARATPM